DVQSATAQRRQRLAQRGGQDRGGVSVDYLELLDWRRQMADLFSEVRRRGPSVDTLGWFRQQKDELFRTHPQSPLPPTSRATFKGLAYWPYDPEGCVGARFVPEMPSPSLSHFDGRGTAPELLAIGRLEFTYRGTPCSLGVFWMAGYGGGLFVPFRDASSGTETYGGGRYLTDSIKSADLGSDFRSGTVVLDFNYAYHPSCAYDAAWSCPLAPTSNHLAVAVRAGERS
ncbi:MAG: DUF1684 domain-containing protein, partial [Chloroflexota bacterium]